LRRTDGLSSFTFARSAPMFIGQDDSLARTARPRAPGRSWTPSPTSCAGGIGQLSGYRLSGYRLSGYRLSGYRRVGRGEVDTRKEGRSQVGRRSEGRVTLGVQGPCERGRTSLPGAWRACQTHRAAPTGAERTGFSDTPCERLALLQRCCADGVKDLVPVSHPQCAEGSTPCPMTLLCFFGRPSALSA
jgi:hypothetical protein